MSRTRYYEPFFDRLGWYFWIPDKDGPFPGTGDIRTGPYANVAACQTDLMLCKLRAEAYHGS